MSEFPALVALYILCCTIEWKLFFPVIEPLYMRQKSRNSKKDDRFCQTGLPTMLHTVC